MRVCVHDSIDLRNNFGRYSSDMESPFNIEIPKYMGFIKLQLKSNGELP